jgi:hypothetical protein
MKRIPLLLVLLTLSCASDTYDSRSAQLSYWSNHYEKQAAAGQLKWSEYYKGLYAHFYFVPELTGHELYLRWSIAQLEAALAAEQRKISNKEFVSFQKQMNQLMRGFAGSGGRARSPDEIALFNQYLQPLEDQATKYYDGTVTCVATEFNRVYTARCQ